MLATVVGVVIGILSILTFVSSLVLAGTSLVLVGLEAQHWEAAWGCAMAGAPQPSMFYRQAGGRTEHRWWND